MNIKEIKVEVSNNINLNEIDEEKDTNDQRIKYNNKNTYIDNENIVNNNIEKILIKEKLRKIIMKITV